MKCCVAQRVSAIVLNSGINSIYIKIYSIYGYRACEGNISFEPLSKRLGSSASWSKRQAVSLLLTLRHG